MGAELAALLLQDARSLSGQVSPGSKASEAKPDLSICGHHPDYKPRHALGVDSGVPCGNESGSLQPCPEMQPSCFPRGLDHSMRGIS